MIFRLRRTWYLITSVLFLVSVGIFLGLGLPWGIDFTGGNLANLTLPEPLPSEQIQRQLSDRGLDALVQSTGNRSYLVRYTVRDKKEALPTADELSALLPGAEVTSFTSVGPSMGRNLQNKAIWAVAIASVGIIIYLAWSFRGVGKMISAWSFGAFAVVALIHDIVVTTGIISLVGHFTTAISIDAYFITAVLTVLAYSVNDTIVVYDRLREVVWKNPSLPIATAIERSVQQTASRSLNTSLTVVFAVLPLLILAGGPLLTFLLTLAIGVLIGTYSSIFLAAPLLGSWQNWQRRPRHPQRKTKRR